LLGKQYLKHLCKRTDIYEMTLQIQSAFTIWFIHFMRHFNVLIVIILKVIANLSVKYFIVRHKEIKWMKSKIKKFLLTYYPLLIMMKKLWRIPYKTVFFPWWTFICKHRFIRRKRISNTIWKFLHWFITIWWVKDIIVYY